MRILFLSRRLPHAGVTGGLNLVRQRIIRLARRGHEVGLAAFGREGDRERAEELRPHLLELELVDAPRPRTSLRRSIDYFFSAVPPWFLPAHDPVMSRRVGDMVDHSHYDVVMAEYSEMGQHLFHNPALPAVRRVVSCHHSAVMIWQSAADVLGLSAAALKQWFRNKGLMNYEFEMYRSMDRVLVLTPQERFGLLDRAPNLRIAVVPNGVDTDYFKPRDCEGGEPAIIYTGRYRDEANEDAVLWFARKVWPELKRRHAGLKFYVIGPDPTYPIRELGRRDPQVVVTGLVEDVRPYLARSQVFVCPLRMGTGMRGKVLEAMASGLPVVSTMLGIEGIPAQVGDNCYLADQPEIMLRYVDLLLSDLPLRESVAAHARDMVVERFDWERSVSRLENVLEEVVNK